MGAALQMVMPFAPAVSYRLEDFLRGAANETALTLMERWPHWPHSIMLLLGPQGSGKTHLAHVFAHRSQAMFIAPERIGKQTADQLLAGHHAWVLDGLEQVKDEAALAQLINYARARGDYLLITAQQPPKPNLPDLASRIYALPTVTLYSPDDALLAGVLAKGFADRQIRVGPEILRYAVTYLERSYEAAQQFAARLDEAAMVRRQKISLNLVRELLQS